MNFIVDKDGIRTSETDNRYEQTRRRITKFRHKQDMSDKEIIGYLAEEIQQYRKRIRKQEDYIRELNNKQTVSSSDTREDTDIEEIETINKFADGRLIQSINNYKYRENTCPEIKIGLHPSG